MHFSTIALFVVGLAYVSALPAAPAPSGVSDEQKKLVADLKQAFEPVAVQVRGLFENGEKAVENVGGEAAKAGERLMDSAKNLFNTVQHADRANLPANLMEKAAGIRDEMQADVRTLLEKAVESAQPMKGNLRSILFSARDAMEAIEKKYLTEDGRDLLRTLANVAGARAIAPKPVEAPKPVVAPKPVAPTKN